MLQVPRGHVWLEGDNLDNSSDSRTYGPVPYGLIRSRVYYKVGATLLAGFLHANWTIVTEVVLQSHTCDK